MPHITIQIQNKSMCTSPFNANPCTTTTIIIKTWIFSPKYTMTSHVGTEM